MTQPRSSRAISLGVVPQFIPPPQHPFHLIRRLPWLISHSSQARLGFREERRRTDLCERKGPLLLLDTMVVSLVVPSQSPWIQTLSLSVLVWLTFVGPALVKGILLPPHLLIPLCFALGSLLPLPEPLWSHRPWLVVAPPPL